MGVENKPHRLKPAATRPGEYDHVLNPYGHAFAIFRVENDHTCVFAGPQGIQIVELMRAITVTGEALGWNVR